MKYCDDKRFQYFREIFSKTLNKKQLNLTTTKSERINNTRHIVLILFALLFIQNISAQSYITQRANYIDPVVTNPANAGADLLPKAIMMYDMQMAGIAQSPSSFFVSGQMRVGNLNYSNRKKYSSFERVGLAAGLYADKNGPVKETSLLLTYSYHIPLKDDASLSFGITGKLNSLGANNAELKATDAGDAYAVIDTKMSGATNIGAMYYDNDYYFGVSAVNIVKLFSNEYMEDLENNLFYISGGYKFRLMDEKLQLIPSLSYAYNVSVEDHLFDYHLKGQYAEYGWASLSYLYNNRIAIMGAVNVYRSIYLGYRYCSGSSDGVQFGNGSHGIVLGKNIGISKIINE